MATKCNPAQAFSWVLVETPGLPKWLGGNGKYGANVFLGTAPGNLHWTIWRNRPGNRAGSLQLSEGYAKDADTAKAAIEHYITHLRPIGTRMTEYDLRLVNQVRPDWALDNGHLVRPYHGKQDRIFWKNGRLQVQWWSHRDADPIAHAMQFSHGEGRVLAPVLHRNDSDYASVREYLEEVYGPPSLFQLPWKAPELPKSGLYFESRAWDEADEELSCYPIARHLLLMAAEGQEERRIIPARPEKGSQWFYCAELDFTGDPTEHCGQACADYSPLNGKRGRCKHHRPIHEPFGDELLLKLDGSLTVAPERKCRVCGCTENNCSGCKERTGQPCTWEAPDLCSACVHPSTN